MVYKWKSGSRIKGDPQESGELMERLAATEEGLTARALLEANVPEGAPLHDDYEWDDDVAADKWRLQQSNQFIASLTVVVFEEKEGEKVDQPRAFHITTQEHSYDPLNVILSEQSKYEAMLRNAMAELGTFKRKYEVLSELKPVFKAYEEVKEG